MTTYTATEMATHIAKRLTAIRLQKAWTREVLAEKAGINVHTLKRFERTGQVSFERLIAISIALGADHEIERLFKPRQRVNVDNWEVQDQPTRKRGKRKSIIAQPKEPNP